MAERRKPDHGRRLRASLGSDPRSHPCNEGALDKGPGRVSRQILQFSTSHLIPETLAAAAPTYLRRCKDRRKCVPARYELRQWLDAVALYARANPRRPQNDR